MTSERPEAIVGTREQVVAQTFVRLADTLVEDYDLVELLDQLVASCLDLLRASAAALLIDDQRGGLAVVAASSEETRLLEVFQLQNDEGPCLDCVQRGEIVASGQLEVARERWPRFAPAAVAAGFQSVAAIPMRLRAKSLGALNLFAAGRDAISEDDQRLAQALADVATIGILQERTLHQTQVVSAQLEHALNSRVVIEQAKGMLAERHGTDMASAYEVLRRYARTHNRKATDVSSQLVSGELALSSLEPPADDDLQRG